MKSQTRALTQSAIMIALAFVLSMLKLFQLPNGGSITPASMAPIILISLMYNTKWGLFTSCTYAVLQMVEGFYAPPVQTLGNFILVVLLDYVIAFGCLGLANLFAKPFGNKKILGGVVASAIVVFLRYLCHFISGVLIWGVYAPEGTPVWIYSLGVNGSLMLGEMIITVPAMFILLKYLPISRMKTATL